MKKLLSCLLVMIGLVSLLRTPVCAEEVHTSARAYVLYCADNGEYLLSKNADERLPMASTTKIMTALLTLEASARENRVITFDEDMIAEGSSMYLEPGEQVTLRDLAVGMLMQSGNDAANAAAIALGGSPDGFCAMMNARAQALGMRDTHFMTPSGLDADGHFTTARDMALLMSAAMLNADFADITGRREMSVTFVEPNGKTVNYPNHNKLLFMYSGCIGGKTGYTDSAGRCLVTCAERDGLRLIAVTLDDGNDWDDHIALYDCGFARYRAFIPEQPLITAKVVGGEADDVTLRADQPVKLVLPAAADAEPITRILLSPFLYAPVQSGEKVGTVRVLYENKIVAETPLVAADDIPCNTRRRSPAEYIKDLLNWHNQ